MMKNNRPYTIKEWHNLLKNFYVDNDIDYSNFGVEQFEKDLKNSPYGDILDNKDAYNIALYVEQEFEKEKSLSKYKKGTKIKSYLEKGSKINSKKYIFKKIDEASPTDAKEIKELIKLNSDSFESRDKYYVYWEEKFGESINSSIAKKKEHECAIVGIESNYPVKEPEIVWNEWNKKQRRHFLDDHGFKEEELYELVRYDSLSNKIKLELKKHIEEGRYEKGGKIESSNYQKELIELDKITAFKVIPTKYGTIIKPYEYGDSYQPSLMITKGQLLSLVIESFKIDYEKDSLDIDIKYKIRNYLEHFLK